MSTRQRAEMAFTLGVTAAMMPFGAWANGTIETRQYSVDALIRIVIAAIGGVIAILGVVLAFKNATARTDVNLARTSLQMKGVTQGVMIAILGVLVLVAGLYFLPSTVKEEIFRGKEITTSPGGGLHMRD